VKELSRKKRERGKSNLEEKGGKTSVTIFQEGVRGPPQKSVFCTGERGEKSKKARPARCRGKSVKAV